MGLGFFCSFLERKEFGQKHSRLERERVSPARYSLFFPIFASASSSTGRADVKIKRTSCGCWYRVHSWLVPIFPTIVWAICEDSDITDGTFAQMRGANTRTAGHRVFLFILKAKIEFVCLTYIRKHNIYRIRGRLIASPTGIKTILFSMRSFFDCRGGYYPPEVISITK